MRFLASTLLAFALSGAGALAQGAPATGGPCIATDALGATPRPAGGRVTIEQICSNGLRIGSATIGVALGSGPSAATPIATGTSFDTPATFTTPTGVTIDVISSNGNQQRVSPSTSVFQNVGKLGEFFSVVTGNVRAFVSNRLSFYNIQSLKVVAASRGTVFDVDAKPDVAVTFSITEGKISLSRLVSIRLTDENRTVDGIRETDTITPTGVATITYTVPFPIYKVFQNAAEAQQYFKNQLNAAQAAGDELQIENALENIDRVSGLVPPAALNPSSAHAVANEGAANPSGANPPVANPSVANPSVANSSLANAPVAHTAVAGASFSAPVVGIFAGVLAVVSSAVSTDGFSSKTTSNNGTIKPPPTQGGTVTLQSKYRRHVSFAVPIRL